MKQEIGKKLHPNSTPRFEKHLFNTNNEWATIQSSHIHDQSHDNRSNFVDSLEAGCNKEDYYDLFPYFRGIIILGRLLGILPCSGVFSRNYRNLKCRVCSLATLISLLCILLLAFNAGLAILDAVRASKRHGQPFFYSIQNPLFACCGLFLYVYFLVRRKLFVRIFEVWTENNTKLVYSRKDDTLYLTIVIISIILFMSTVAENAVLHLEYFQKFDHITGRLERYGPEYGNHPIPKMFYWRAFLHWNNQLGYRFVYVPLAFLVHKLALYGWNYMDVFSALFFRAMYFKFKALCEVAEERLLKGLGVEKSGIFELSSSNREAWNQVAYDHYRLCEILRSMNEFFSPILFVSYAVNIYIFCVQLLLGLIPENTTQSYVHSTYVTWSFIHITVRVFILTLFTSKVNDYAYKIGEVLMHCPVQFYDGPIFKLDKRINTGRKLGVTGLGCFVISRPFMLSILNVVFTLEIVLFQGKLNNCG